MQPTVSHTSSHTSAHASSHAPPSLLGHLREQRGLLAAGVAALVATNALDTSIPWLIKGAIDALGAHGSAAASSVAHAALLIAAAAILQAGTRTLSRIFIFNAGRQVEYTLRRDLFAHLLRLPPSFYRGHPTGDLMSRLTNDLSAVRMVFGPGVLNLTNTVVAYVSRVSFMLALSPRLTAVALVTWPVLILAGRAATRSVQQSSRALQDEMGHLASRIQEDLAGMSVIKLFGLEGWRIDALGEANARVLQRAMALVRSRGAMQPLFGGIGAIGTLLVLWVGGREVLAHRMTVGALVAFNAYVVALVWPTTALGWTFSLWQRGAGAWERLREIFAARPDVAEPGSLHTGGDAPLGTDISVAHLSLTIDGRPVLDDVSFDVPAGKTVALVGRAGAGKSLLADALLHLRPVPPGTVFVGGRDVCELPLSTLRQSIGYAPQDAFLFSTTVAENIAFGRPRDGEPDAVAAASHAAGLQRDLAAWPAGLQTVVGERGVTVSGGQRQRIALARALFGKPGILVLDDSLSSVDAETEQAILAALRPVLAGRTVLLISHRVAAVRDAEQIVVLDEGRVVERGRHAELLARGGLYARLYHEGEPVHV